MTISPGRISRREWLLGSTLTAGGLLSGACGKDAAQVSAPLSGAALFRDVQRYAGYEHHRTGGGPDRRTAEWLQSELNAAGWKTEQQSFEVPQFELAQCTVSAFGSVLKGFPLWPPVMPEADPLVASLILLSSDGPSTALRGNIACLRIPYEAAKEGSTLDSLKPYLAPAFEAGAAAVVALTESPTGEVVAFGNHIGAAPTPVPVVLMAEHEASLLEPAAREARSVSISLQGTWNQQASAVNVIGEFGDSGPVIVVTTPYSGWFRCGGERGPGVALWLGLARRIAETKAPGRYIFCAVSGEELGQLGMAQFLNEKAPAASEVRCWAHLGSGFGARQWDIGKPLSRALPEPTSDRYLLAAGEKLRPLLERAFAPDPVLRAVSEKPAAEARFLIERRYTGFALTGWHDYQRTPADDAATTSAELLEPLGAALALAIKEVGASA